MDKIATLAAGGSVRISGDAKCWVEAERSGDGKTLRFVRFTRAGKTVTAVVFKTCAF